MLCFLSSPQIYLQASSIEHSHPVAQWLRSIYQVNCAIALDCIERSLPYTTANCLGWALALALPAKSSSNTAVVFVRVCLSIVPLPCLYT